MDLRVICRYYAYQDQLYSCMVSLVTQEETCNARLDHLLLQLKTPIYML
jgi:hypothetical protein